MCLLSLGLLVSCDVIELIVGSTELSKSGALQFSSELGNYREHNNMLSIVSKSEYTEIFDVEHFSFSGLPFHWLQCFKHTQKYFSITF